MSTTVQKLNEMYYLKQKESLIYRSYTMTTVGVADINKTLFGVKVFFLNICFVIATYFPV